MNNSKYTKQPYLHTELSNPSVNNIMKNRMAHNVDPGSVAIASGYTTNTKPGPDAAQGKMKEECDFIQCE